MRTTRWAPLGLASALALASVAAVSAQEQEQERQQDYQQQQKEITIQLAGVENSNASGTAVVRFTGDQADPAAGEKTAEVQYDVRGLEPSTSYTVVIHQGACATGTTRIADLGSVESDENGAIQETVEVNSQEALAVLSGERGGAMEAEEEEQQEQEEQQERQEMSREGTRHLQLQVNGQAVACGNFEPGS